MADPIKPTPPKAPTAFARGTRSDTDLPEPGHLPAPSASPSVPMPVSGAARAVPGGPKVIERVRQPAPVADPPPVALETEARALPAVREVKVVFEKFRPPADDELAWVQTPVLGSQARVFQLDDGSRVRFAAHAAAMVLSYSVEPELTTVYVRCRFFPDPGTDWDRKLKSRNKARLKELRAAIAFALARVKLSSGLVIRFAGGPPMSEQDASLSGYTFWSDPDRAPVRAEFSRDYIRQREAELKGVYERLNFLANYHRYIILAWWWCFNRAKLAAYRTGERLVSGLPAPVPPQLTGIDPFAPSGKQSTEARHIAVPVSKLVAPVMQSLVSLAWFGENASLRSALLEKGVPAGDERKTRLGTIADDESLYGDGQKVRR